MSLFRSFYRRLSIKWKFLSILTSIILLVFLISMLALSLTFHLYDRQILNISSEILNLNSTGIENELRKIDSLTFKFISDPKSRDNLITINTEESSYERYQAIEELKIELFQASQSESYISSVSYFDNDGHEYTVGSSVEGFTDSYLRQLFQELDANKGGIVWLPPMKSDTNFIAAREIRSIDNLRPIGYVAIRINPVFLVNWVSSTWPDFRGYLVITTKDGEVIYQDPRLEQQQMLLNTLQRQAYQIQKVNGQKYLLTELTSSYTNWSYSNFISYENIFKGILIMRTTMVIIFILLFFGVLLIGIKFSGNITKPIIYLSQKMKRIENGDFGSVGILYIKDETGDEIMQLRNQFVIMVEKIDALIKENYVKQLVIKESELKALQAQINPHFLYNTLESINWEARINKHHKISTMVKALGNLLRKTTNQSQPVTTVEEELQLLEEYFTIQKFRYEERLQLQVEVDPQIKSCPIVKMSLQPLVENAIKYGLEKKSGICRIRIKSRFNGNRIEISVSDNGPGMSPEYLEQLRKWEIEPQGSGIGLKNIDDRLKLIFGGGSGIHIDSHVGEGTTVTLNIVYQ